mmetsp:Transcript_18129/g.25159  ORF Transcript_18129/g.25159 Transcript_18129/m.25159 type:complete len:325 (+) Transcript_18129:13-987(+)
MSMARRAETKRRAKPAQVFKLKEGTPDIESIDWKLFDERLPSDTSKTSKLRRAEIFVGFDPNGNGFLSLAEIEKGLMGHFHYGVDVKRVVAKSVQRAHKAAKAAAPDQKAATLGKASLADDFVEKREFRIFIEFLRYDLQILMYFLKADTSDDLRVSLEEFKAAMPFLTKETNLPEPKDLEAAYREMDADGGGMVLYDEFADYMMKYKVANPSAKLQQVHQSSTPSKPKGKAITARKPKSNTRNSHGKNVSASRNNHRTLTKASASSGRRSPASKRSSEGSKISEVVAAKLTQMEEKLMKHFDSQIGVLMVRIADLEKKLSASN